MPPQPRPKPTAPSRLENLGYGLGDVEYLSELYPYIKDDPLARLGLQGFDRGQTRRGLADLIDTDPEHKKRYSGSTVRGTYRPSEDSIYVGTTDAPDWYNQKYWSGLPIAAHELRHRGTYMSGLIGIDATQAEKDRMHRKFDVYDSEALLNKYGDDGIPDLDTLLLRSNGIGSIYGRTGLNVRRSAHGLDDMDAVGQEELDRRGVPPQIDKAEQQRSSFIDSMLRTLLNLK